MKNIKTVISTMLILALALVLNACSCPFGGKVHVIAPTEAPSAEESPSAAEESPEAEGKSPELMGNPVSGEDGTSQLCDDEPALAAEFGVERFVAQMSGDRIVTDAEDEYASKVVFTAKRDIRDFRYFEISAEFSDNGEMRVSGGEILHARDEMNGGDVLVISMDLEGCVPSRAISYVDDCGGTHCFCVAVSGEDNVPVLIACTLPE